LSSANGTVANGAFDRRDAIKSVLVVEDNMLIALDTEDALHEAGVAKVFLAANARAAMAELARELPDFGLLDFNLGDSTSEEVAEALSRAGVPFCYATGYGEAMLDAAREAPCGVLKKPYSRDEIAAALDRAAAGC
jgi:DNA-binding NtrC family response regulator